MIKKRWVADNEKNDIIDKLSYESGLNKALVRILVNRNIETAEEIEDFLNPSLSELCDPFLLNDMDKAVKRIREGIKKNETVCVYGDYDVDGVTASAILTRYLRDKVKVINYIPDRESEGYGVNKEAILKIKNQGAGLIITVDCGITSVEEAKYATELGIDLIITDHHTCPEKLPECIAVINPKRENQKYPFRELCGAGVAFKLVCALGEKNLTEYLCICAVGTVADIVPLVSENRIIVYYGIKYLRENKLKEITALCHTAGIESNDINSVNLSFMIAPRINAAGRMASAKDALTLFLSEDEYIIKEKAELLNTKNLLRQETEKEIYNQVKKAIEGDSSYKDKSVLVVAGEDWHEGVIGIVASKITEEYYKPCVLISMGNDVGKGSSRSIKGFNIYDALKAQSEYLIKFGGHKLAAGLTVDKSVYPEFKRKIEEYAENIINEKLLIPELYIDSELVPEDMTEEFTEELKKLEPYGMGNPQPVFLVRDAEVVKSIAFKDNRHLRLSVRINNKVTEAIAFNMGAFAQSLKERDKIYIAGTANINEYKGQRSFQIRIKDIKRRV